MALADLEHKLREFGQRTDNEIPLMPSLLMLGAVDRQVPDTAFYAHHITMLHDALKEEIDAHPLTSGGAVLTWRLERLNAVLRDQFVYGPDHDSYDDPDAVNLLTVIDRRKGIPVALGALYMDLAEHQAWPIAGLNFPGHFFLRLEDEDRHLIFDPFHDGLEIHELAMLRMLKTLMGERAKIHPDYYHTVTKRDVLLRFYNNRKTRFITRGAYEEALQTLVHQLWVAPHEPRLYFEAGVLYIKLGQIRFAIDHLDEFIQISTDALTVSEARDMIRGLQRLLQ